MGQYLQTPNEIAAVEQALSDLVCPTLPEDKIEACIDFVYSNWEAMATALFAYENTLTDICGALGYCTKFQRVLKEYIQYFMIKKIIHFVHSLYTYIFLFVNNTGLWS